MNKVGKSVLLLNASYEPLGVVSLKHAICLVVLEKAESVETDGLLIRSPSFNMIAPSVIRLGKYIKLNRRNTVKYSRKNILKRDNHTCFVGSTNILMSNGDLKQIKDIKVGDQILDYNGNIQEVEYVFSKKVSEKEMLEIRARGNGNSIKCTKEHKILVMGENNKIVEKQASSLTLDDKVFSIIPSTILKQKNNNISNDLLDYNKHLRYVRLTKTTIKHYCGHVVNRFFKFDNAFGRIVGLFLAEGSCLYRSEGIGKGGGWISFTFNINEKEYVKEVSEFFRSVFHVPVKINRYPKKHTCVVLINSTLICNLFRRLCYIGCNTKIKRFCEKRFSREFLEGVLTGILDGDGHFRPQESKVSLVLKLYNLIQDIQIVSNALNIYPTISKEYNKKDGRKHSCLSFQAEEFNKIITISKKDMVLWPRKPYSKIDRVIIADKYISSKLTEIKTFNYTGIVYDLQISGSHTYVANGIAVHNCQYCGKTGTDLTIDHVMPLSRGGKNWWDNVVACCDTCNNKKADKTPTEAGMKLATKPKEPDILYFIRKAYAVSGERRPQWRKYLFMDE